jgi:hypothetical protein
MCAGSVDGQTRSATEAAETAMPNERLTMLALERLSNDELPGDVAVTTLGGTSRGASCRLCCDAVRAGEPEIELVWADRHATQRRAALHPTCHGAWLLAARLQQRRA